MIINKFKKILNNLNENDSNFSSLENFNNSLKEDDKRFENCVFVASKNDYTQMFYEDSFALEDKKNYYIFTKNHGIDILLKEEYEIFLLKKIPIEKKSFTNEKKETL